MQNDLAHGAGAVGGTPALRPNRKLEILTKDFTSAEQVTPVPVAWGMFRISGRRITPIFGFRSVAITRKVGK